MKCLKTKLTIQTLTIMNGKCFVWLIYSVIEFFRIFINVFRSGIFNKNKQNGNKEYFLSSRHVNLYSKKKIAATSVTKKNNKRKSHCHKHAYSTAFFLHVTTFSLHLIFFFNVFYSFFEHYTTNEANWFLLLLIASFKIKY